MDKWQKYGLKCPLDVDITTHPHTLLIGSSGSGKSYALKWMLRNLVQSNKINLTFCNFKDSSDFHYLKNCSYCLYYTINDCIIGFDTFYNDFKTAQKNSKEYDGTLHVLIFDEFPAFISWLTMENKKQAAQIQIQLSEMLMLSRSYGFSIFVVCQRPDSVIFGQGGARDNFFITISLGNLSKEGKAMIFSGFEIEEQIFSVGEGIAKIDGVGCVNVKYPKIDNITNIEKQTLNGLENL